MQRRAVTESAAGMGGTRFFSLFWIAISLGTKEGGINEEIHENLGSCMSHKDFLAFDADDVHKFINCAVSKSRSIAGDDLLDHNISATNAYGTWDGSLDVLGSDLLSMTAGDMSDLLNIHLSTASSIVHFLSRDPQPLPDPDHMQHNSRSFLDEELSRSSPPPCRQNICSM